MGRENKKQAVAALHREKILQAAEKLFSEKGFDQTTIQNISQVSSYSRRTIYAYYDSKEDIMHHIIENGLLQLSHDIQTVLQNKEGFLSQYFAVCAAMVRYQTDCPQSFKHVMEAHTENLNLEQLADTVQRIFALGTEINEHLARWIEEGKQQKVVRRDVVPLMTVYVLWSSVTSFIDLVQTKGAFLCKQFAMTQQDLYAYGFRQIINGILEERISHE